MHVCQQLNVRWCAGVQITSWRSVPCNLFLRHVASGVSMRCQPAATPTVATAMPTTNPLATILAAFRTWASLRALRAALRSDKVLLQDAPQVSNRIREIFEVLQRECQLCRPDQCTGNLHETPSLASGIKCKWSKWAFNTSSEFETVDIGPSQLRIMYTKLISMLFAEHNLPMLLLLFPGLSHD